MIVDAHMHIFDRISGFRNRQRPVTGGNYGKVTVDGIAERWMPPSFRDSAVTIEVAVEYMDWIGVSRAVLLQAPVYGEKNDYVVENIAKFPDRFLGFGLVDPDDPKASEGVKQIKQDLGLSGVKFEVPDTPFWLDDPKYLPMWKTIHGQGLVVVLDLGWDKDDNPYCCQVDQLKAVLDKLPQLKVVVAHLGVSRLWDSTQKYPFPVLQKTLTLAEYPNLWFDLAALPMFCPGEEYPYPRAQEIIRVAYEKVGAERLIWGSDFPTLLQECTYRQLLNLVKNYCDFIPHESKEKILGGNAADLYGLK
jgi:hypothetical protein